MNDIADSKWFLAPHEKFLILATEAPEAPDSLSVFTYKFFADIFKMSSLSYRDICCNLIMKFRLSVAVILSIDICLFTLVASDKK